MPDVTPLAVSELFARPAFFAVCEADEAAFRPNSGTNLTVDTGFDMCRMGPSLEKRPPAVSDTPLVAYWLNDMPN